MIRIFAVAGLLATGPSLVTAEPFETMFPGHVGYDVPGLMEILTDLDYRRGHILLPGDRAALNVPDEFYYLDPADTETVLTRLWGNPEGASLGMLFPAQWTPWDLEAWGAELTWDPIGHVSDIAWRAEDKAVLLRRMQFDTHAESQERLAAGYDSVDLAGWAVPPRYDAELKVLHWALDLRFGNTEGATLNYKLRALGRDGVLNTNFIAGLDQLAQIEGDVPVVAAMIAFLPGHRHDDFDPAKDPAPVLALPDLIAGARP